MSVSKFKIGDYVVVKKITSHTRDEFESMKIMKGNVYRIQDIDEDGDYVLDGWYFSEDWLMEPTSLHKAMFKVPSKPVSE